MEVTCAACGAPNPGGRKFCGECGAALAATCPACAAPAEIGQKFCGECGARLAAEPASFTAPPPGPTAALTVATGAEGVATPVAERRVCSVLFADLVGFTPLSESRDPEEVRELLTGYFETARTVIDRYGGVVEKFIGDAVMAVWGTPVAGEDDAERAVRAGLELLNAVSGVGAQAGVPALAARVGVVTGEVAVTLGATAQGMAAGDAVNTAARVQAAATPGQVWVDETTHRLAPRLRSGSPTAANTNSRARAAPTRLWAATRVLAGVGGAQRVDGLEAPLLGRDSELRLIKDLFHAAVDRRTPTAGGGLRAGRCGQVKAGLGVREVRRRVGGRRSGGTAAAACPMATAWCSGRWLQIVRQRLGIAEEDSTDTRRQQARREVVRVPVRSRTSGRTSRCGWAAYSGSRCMPTPAAQWPAPNSSPGGDCSSNGWPPRSRSYSSSTICNTPTPACWSSWTTSSTGPATCRSSCWCSPGRTWNTPGRGGPPAATGPGLPSTPSTGGRWTTLVEALVPGMPAAARRTIIGQAQGDPTVCGGDDPLVDRPRHRRAREKVSTRWSVMSGRCTVPDGLHALLAARLDALDPDLRVLVADAAVLGSILPGGSAGRGLRAGRGRRCVRAWPSCCAVRCSRCPRTSCPRSAARYRFAQNLLGQVAYETLSRRDRKARHLAVAAHLRATFAGDGDEVIDAVARHYQDALVAVPDDPDAGQHPVAGGCRVGPRRAAGPAIRRAARCVRPTTPPPPP